MNLKEYGKRFLLSAVSAAMVISAAAYLPEMQADAAQTSTISNPVIWADVPDVDVIRVGDTYYMVSTTMYFSPGAPIMKSKDLVSWEICNYVYDTYADGDVYGFPTMRNFCKLGYVIMNGEVVNFRKALTDEELVARIMQ